MKHLLDSQSLGKLTWSLIANRFFTSKAITVLTGIEGLISIFYALLMQ